MVQRRVNLAVMRADPGRRAVGGAEQQQVLSCLRMWEAGRGAHSSHFHLIQVFTGPGWVVSYLLGSEGWGRFFYKVGF